MNAMSAPSRHEPVQHADPAGLFPVSTLPGIVTVILHCGHRYAATEREGFRFVELGTYPCFGCHTWQPIDRVLGTRARDVIL